MARSRRKKNKDSDHRFKYLKILAGVVVLFGFGGGMYFAGQARLLQSGASTEVAEADQEKVVKKPVASKPMRAFGAVLDGVEQNKADNFQYTFFEVLNDPGLNSFVDLKGNVTQKIVPVSASSSPKPAVQVQAKTPPKPVKQIKPSAPVNSKAPQEKKKSVHSKKKKVDKKTEVVGKKKPETKNSKWVLSSLDQLDEKSESFLVQVASFRKLEQAKAMEERVRLKGYFPFIRSIEIKGKGTWHRVYLGTYPSREIAARYAEKATKELKLKPVVMKAG